MTWGRIETASFLRSSGLWALGTVAAGFLLGLAGGGRSWTLAILMTALYSWLCAVMSGPALRGSLARRPFAVRLATVLVGGLMLRGALLFLSLVMSDLPYESPFELAQVLLVGGLVPWPLTSDAIASLAVGIVIPVLVIALVDWRWRAGVALRTPQAGEPGPDAGVEQAFRADSRTLH